MFVNILGYKIFSKSKQELLEYMDSYEKVNIVSGNPEILYNGMKDDMLKKSFTSSRTIIIPDGVGTVLASKIKFKPVTEKIAGIEVMDEVLKKCTREGKKVYLLGGKKEVVEKAKDSIEKKHNGINIVGYHDGYFDLENCEKLVDHIVSLEPYAIFVAMGCPRQEIFIENYMDVLPCKIYMGVGGSFDVYAGNTKRAPKIMIDLGLEWLYRVSKEPFRIKRLMSIPKFLFRVVFDNQRWRRA